MKLDRISITVPKEILEKSDKIANEKLENRSTVIRELLALGLNQYMIEDALRLYSEGKISMEKTSEIANVSIWKILDVMKERKIPIRYDLEDIKKEIENIIKILCIIYSLYAIKFIFPVTLFFQFHNLYSPFI